MAQDITWLGMSLPGIPAIRLPKTGGGFARFDDATPTTAVDEDVAQGKIYLRADGSLGTGTGSGSTLPDGDNLGYGGAAIVGSAIVGTATAG